MCLELSHLRSIDIAFWWCDLYMDHGQLSSICRRTMRIIGRVVMPKFRNTCSLINRVNSDRARLHLISQCNRRLSQRAMGTLIELQGRSAFNSMRCSDLLTQYNYITCMLVNINHDTFQSRKLVSLICRMLK